MYKYLYPFIIVISLVNLTHAAPIPPAPNLNVKAYVLMDFDSGMILASTNKDLTLPPASITKMMTAYLAFTELNENNISLNENTSGPIHSIVCPIILLCTISKIICERSVT